MRRWIWPAIVVVIAVAAYVMIGDVNKVADRLGAFRWSAFAVAIGLAFVNYAIRFARWQLYLRWQDVRVPTRSSALVFGAGLSLAITPGKLGELVKSYLLRELHDVPVARTAPIVVAERVSDLVALVVLSVIGVAAYGMQPGLVIAAAALVVLGLVLLAWPAPTRMLIDLVTQPAFARRFRPTLHEVYAGLVDVCRPARLIVSTAFALPAWGAECLGFALIVGGFPGADVPLGIAIVIYAATTIAGALSFLPGGLGVTEGMMTLALVRWRLDRATAVAATLLTRLATLWFAVLLGIAFLTLARRRIRRRVL